MDSHALPPLALDQIDGLMAFNWLTAAYAHPDWLGPWADILGPRHLTSVRLLRRASLMLLERHGLRQRYIRHASDISDLTWLLVSQEKTHLIAEELGVAMLGGWVRHSLERHAVAQQLHVLGPQRRSRALTYANNLRALPYAQHKRARPMVLMGPRGVLELGVSCMAALLHEHSTGAKERFVMRFAQGVVAPLSLEMAERGEALELIQRLMSTHEVQV